MLSLPTEELFDDAPQLRAGQRQLQEVSNLVMAAPLLAELGLKVLLASESPSVTSGPSGT